VPKNCNAIREQSPTGVVPGTSFNTATVNNPQQQGDGNDGADEFGDVLDFTMDDLALMDSLVQQAKTTSQQSQTELPPAPAHSMGVAMKVEHHNSPTTKSDDDPFGDFPDFDMDAVLKQAEDQRRAAETNTKVEAVPVSAASAPNDPFGDFPEIDFEAIDKVVAERKMSTTQGSSTHLQQQQQQPQWSAVPPPAANAVVRNPRTFAATGTGDDRSFLTFSRYKVLRVEEDFSTFTKTLTLATWTTEMLEEEEKVSRALHQCKSRRPSSSTADDDNTSTRSVAAASPAGVVHLRGEWYHTRMADGDVIHICSLAGHFRTDRLPLILHTCPPPGSDADDLVMIVHPDMLLTPTVISETVSCTRRAILKNRLGSTGLTGELLLLLFRGVALM